MNILFTLCATLLIYFFISGDGSALSKYRERLVLAHYMVCCPFYGAQATEDQFAQEMELAKTEGIDGFALNIGGWTKEPVYSEVVERIYAASVHVPGFILILSLDFSNISLDEAVDAVVKYTRQPNILRRGGRFVVSSYGGTSETGRLLRTRLAALGIEIFYVPYYDYPHKTAPSGLSPSEHDLNIAETVLEENPDLDGQFYFGAALDGTDLAKVIRGLTQRLRSEGKIALMGISPYYRGLGSNYRVFNALGFNGMTAQWRAAIESQADWIELVTWNDWGESSYLQRKRSFPCTLTRVV